MMYGADADELDRLAGQLDGMAKKLDSARAKVGRSVNSAPWHGRSADRFRGEWASEYSRSLRQAAAYLHDAGRVLHRNAAEQRRASGSMRPIPKRKKSFWERWLAGEFEKALRIAYKVLKNFVSVLKWIGKVKWAAAVLGVVTGVFTIIDSWIDAVSHEYTGILDRIETGIDLVNIGVGILSVVGGIIALAAAASPVGWAILAVAGVIGIGTLIADQGLKFWAKGGGRELWRDKVSPSLSRSWNSAKDMAGAAKRSVGRAVSGAGQVFRDAGRGLKDLFSPRPTRSPSWV